MNKIKDFLKGLIKDGTSAEEAEQIGMALSEVKRIEEEHASLVQSHEELRKKYVKVIRDNSFKGLGEEKSTTEEITLEGLIDNVIKERK